jgi:hypothetical protein
MQDDSLFDLIRTRRNGANHEERSAKKGKKDLILRLSSCYSFLGKGFVPKLFVPILDVFIYPI